MKEIKLSKTGKHAGKYVALVDDEDYERVNKYNWCVNININTNYAVRNVYNPITKKQKTIHMHVFILGDSSDIDHEDRNGLNNQKYNLRFCSPNQNKQNCRAFGSSKFLGVSWFKPTHKWRSIINVNGKNKHLGYFKTEIDAANVYDNAARIHHGEFANLNFK